jgi:hypothetical protein
MTSPRPVSISFLLLWIAAACGGATNTSEGDGGVGGAAGATGGKPGTGGARPGAGGAGTGAAAGTGGVSGGPVCCLAAPACGDGEKQLPPGEPCPTGFDCYDSTVCCATIRCARAAGQCDAYPSCDPGDRELTSSCPPIGGCYSRTLCGTTVWCVKAPSTEGGTACNPAVEHDRRYIGTSPQQCQLIDFGCPSNTIYFSNGCGCGCEQNASCPEWVDCMPGANPVNRLCDAQLDPVPCPYTKRAY